MRLSSYKTMASLVLAITGMSVILPVQSHAQTKSPAAPAASETAKLATEVSDCSKRERSLGQKGSRNNCNAAARNLFQAARQPTKSGYDFYDGSGKFEVLRVGKHLMLLKAQCSDADLAVKTFAWGIQTATPIRPAGGGQPATAFSDIVSFDDVGYRVDGGCLVVIELASATPTAMSVGQYDRDKQTYAWRN